MALAKSPSKDVSVIMQETGRDRYTRRKGRGTGKGEVLARSCRDRVNRTVIMDV